MIPWSTEEQINLISSALREIGYHGHDLDKPLPKVVTDNCAACLLSNALGKNGSLARIPNVAGWASIYVRCSIKIPEKFLRVALQDKNEAYLAVLKRDLLTWPQ